MQKIEDFFGKAPMWKVSIVMMLLVYGMTVGLLMLLSSVDHTLDGMAVRLRMIPVIVGVILGNLAAVMIYHMRKSEKFWDEATRIEEIIKKCTDPVELGRIILHDIQGLRKLTVGLPHDIKIRELKKMANMKADTILELKESDKPARVKMRHELNFVMQLKQTRKKIREDKNTLESLYDAIGKCSERTKRLKAEYVIQTLNK